MMLAYCVGMARGWHRAGFRLYWRWKSRPSDGRPTVPLEMRQLIREMSTANPLWGRECLDQFVVSVSDTSVTYRCRICPRPDQADGHPPNEPASSLIPQQHRLMRRHPPAG